MIRFNVVTWQDGADLVESLGPAEDFAGNAATQGAVTRVFGGFSRGFGIPDNDRLPAWYFYNAGDYDVAMFRGLRKAVQGRNLYYGWIDSEAIFNSLGCNSGLAPAVVKLVLPFIDQHRRQDKPLILVGHSLGGAVAEIAAEFICNEGSTPPVYVLIAGGPIVTRQDRVMTLPVGRTMRLFNAGDGVTRLPTSMLEQPEVASLFSINEIQSALWFQPKVLGRIIAPIASWEPQLALQDTRVRSAGDYVAWMLNADFGIKPHHAAIAYGRSMRVNVGAMPVQPAALEGAFEIVGTQAPRNDFAFAMLIPQESLQFVSPILLPAGKPPAVPPSSVPATWWRSFGAPPTPPTFGGHVKINARVNRQLQFKVGAYGDKFCAAWLDVPVVRFEFRSTAVAWVKRANRMIEFLGRCDAVNITAFPDVLSRFLDLASTPGSGYEPPLNTFL